MKINNRRYIGCKTKLIDIIYKTAKEYYKEDSGTFADLFAGTGVVANKFAKEGYRVILNDTLYSNFVIYNTFFGSEKVDLPKIKKIFSFLNNVEYANIKENYFSNIYGDKYFSKNDAKKIGYIRDWIEDNKNILNKREYYYLITSLLYSADKIANTVGHFESFLKKKPVDCDIKLEELDIDTFDKENLIFNEDSNEVVKKIDCDIAYIDPPYNARQYVNFYHVLENLAKWNKPTDFEGNSMKFKRDELKSGYCRKKAPILFADLIQNLNAKLIIVSYNNTYKAGSISSINMISEDQIFKVLSEKGSVNRVEINYKAFDAGKTNLEGHKEFLYICEVAHE